jgi:hypothetical protein
MIKALPGREQAHGNTLRHSRSDAHPVSCKDTFKYMIYPSATPIFFLRLVPVRVKSAPELFLTDGLHKGPHP